MKKSIIQWAVYSIIGIWGFLSILVIFGDENPFEPISNIRFFAIKAAALASLYACYRVGKICDERRLFPEFKLPEEDMED